MDTGKVPERFEDFLEYLEVTGPRGKLTGLMGHSGVEEAGHGRRHARLPCPNPNWTRGGGVAPIFPSPPLSLLVESY